MRIDNPRILVIGAGVNGSICAAGLHRAGFNTTILARGRHFEKVRDEGIVIENPFKHTRSVTRVPVIASLEADDVYDYILVIVRKNQVSALLPALARNQSLNIVFMVNNPSGLDEWIKALGKDRIMMGFVFGAGAREGNIVRGISATGAYSIVGRLWPTPFGETDGAITPRLTRLVRTLRQAGFNATASRNISDYLTTHAVFVAVLANFAIQHGYDAEAIARYTPADYRLLVDALWEALDVLRALKHRITPPSTIVIKIIPRFVSAAILRAGLNSKYAGVAGLWHLSHAQDEMLQLAIELKEMVEKSGLPVPAIRKVLSMN
jgi:2-dehydropantoate 2-reductase